MEIVIAAVVLAAGLVAGPRCFRAARRRWRARGPAGRRRPAARAAVEAPRQRRRRPQGARAPRSCGSRSACCRGGGARAASAASLATREAAVEAQQAEIVELREHHVRELERVAGLSASQAKQILLQASWRTRSATSARALVRQIEEETKRDADRRVRNILSVVMQRMAAGHAAETTVSVVQLSADDMKGRIIGREGRNIRALEHLTGVDFIIDDTPNAVDPLRLRRRAARDRPHDAREAAAGRAHPPGADRGDLLPGQVRAREPHDGVRGAGRASTPTSAASTPS